MAALNQALTRQLATASHLSDTARNAPATANLCPIAAAIQNSGAVPIKGLMVDNLMQD